MYHAFNINFQFQRSHIEMVSCLLFQIEPGEFGIQSEQNDGSTSAPIDVDKPSDEEADHPDIPASEEPHFDHNEVDVRPEPEEVTEVQQHKTHESNETQQQPQLREMNDDTGVLDIHVLLQSCIQGASSMLQDIGTERTTKRIQQLLGLMDDTQYMGKKTFDAIKRTSLLVYYVGHISRCWRL